MSVNTVEQMAQDFAQGAVDVARTLHIELDYSENSLQQVETILTHLHRELNVPSEGGSASVAPPEEQMDMMCKLWGGYLGEVVRRRWGGEWTVETYPGEDFATLTLNVHGSKLFPSIKVYRRLTEGAVDNIWDFYQAISKKLSKAPGTAKQ